MKPFIIHPGEILWDELEARWRTQSFFAKLIWKSRQEVNHLITWRRDINAEWALTISVALWTEPQFWLNLQNTYDLQNANTQKNSLKFSYIRNRMHELQIA